MSFLAISAAEKRPERGRCDRWVVKHPTNDAILAYCDTEEQANEVIRRLDSLDREVATWPRSAPHG